MHVVLFCFSICSSCLGYLVVEYASDCLFQHVARLTQLLHCSGVRGVPLGIGEHCARLQGLREDSSPHSLCPRLRQLCVDVTHLLNISS